MSAKGRDHERQGRDHERQGRDHERQERDNERQGRNHERQGRDNERQGLDQECQGGDQCRRPPFGSPPPLSSRVFNINTQIIIFGNLVNPSIPKMEVLDACF